MHFSSVRFILKEGRWRLFWAVFCFFITFGTCYCFSEDLFFGLATPYLEISKTSFFICTQITESLNTYMTISGVLGLFFCIPYIFYQLWCFFVPSCTKNQRRVFSKIIIFSIMVFLFVLFGTFIWIMPNIWLFLYKLSHASSETRFFLIKLEPKIYDFSILTLRILFITSLCSQIPIAVLCSIQYSLISIQTLIKSRRIIAFISILLAALVTPPDIWCQLSAWFFILFLFELAIFTGIVQLQYSDWIFSSLKGLKRNSRLWFETLLYYK